MPSLAPAPTTDPGSTLAPVPTEDNHYQAQRMKTLGIFTTVHKEVGQIIVAEVDQVRIKALVDPESDALENLIIRGEMQPA